MVHRVSVATNTLAYMSVYRRLVHGPYLTIPLRILQLNFPGPSRLQTRRRSRGKGDRSLTAMAQLYAPNASLVIVDTPFHTHIYKLIFFFFFCIFIVEIIFWCIWIVLAAFCTSLKVSSFEYFFCMIFQNSFNTVNLNREANKL